MRVSIFVTLSILAISSCATDKGALPRVNRSAPANILGSSSGQGSIQAGVQAMIVDCDESEREGMIKYLADEPGPNRDQPKLSARCDAASGLFNEGLRGLNSDSPDMVRIVFSWFGACNSSDFKGLAGYETEEPGPNRNQPALSARCKIGLDLYNRTLNLLR